MKHILYSFIAFCELANVTPAEDEIDAFLRRERKKDKHVLRNYLIRFCFYHWEKRNDKQYLENLLKGS